MAPTVRFRKWHHLTMILRGQFLYLVLFHLRFISEHEFVAFSTRKASEKSLTLLDTKKENVAEANLEPMKIKVFHFDE
jgi:hypothetical protein